MLHYFLVSNFADEQYGINPVLIPTCSELNSVPPTPQKKIRRKEERDILVTILLLLRRFDRVLSLEGYDGGG